MFASFGISTNTAYFDLYRNVATGILSASLAERNLDAEKHLKGMMFRLVNVLSVSDGRGWLREGRDCWVLGLGTRDAEKRLKIKMFRLVNVL